MIKRSTNTYLFLVLLCASFLSFSQEDDSTTLLKDADDKLIQFENHYFEALKYKAIGNYSRAITELEKCQQLFSDDKAIAFELSKNHLLINKLEEATLYIESSLKQDLENIWLLEHAKKVYLKQYNYPKAIESQQKIIALNPNKKEDLILVYLQAKKYKDAQKIIEELEADQQSSSRVNRFKKILSNYYGKTITVVVNQKVVNTNSKTLESLKKEFDNNKQYNVLKEILKQQFTNENFDNLLIYSNKGLELFPAQPYVYLMNAKALIGNKKYIDAIDVLNSGIDFVVEDVTLEANLYKQLVICYKAINDKIQAQKFQKKVSKLLNKQ